MSPCWSCGCSPQQKSQLFLRPAMVKCLPTTGMEAGSHFPMPPSCGYIHLFCVACMEHYIPSYVLYSNYLQQESNFVGFNVPGHCLVRASLLHCVCGQLRKGYTQAYRQIMQLTHKAVTGCVEAKKFLAEGNQTIDVMYNAMHHSILQSLVNW